jgi:hypothetical protein
MSDDKPLRFCACGHHDRAGLHGPEYCWRQTSPDAQVLEKRPGIQAVPRWGTWGDGEEENFILHAQPEKEPPLRTEPTLCSPQDAIAILKARTTG